MRDSVSKTPRTVSIAQVLDNTHARNRPTKSPQFFVFKSSLLRSSVRALFGDIAKRSSDVTMHKTSIRELTARLTSVRIRRQLLAFTPDRRHNDGVAGRNDERWQHEQSHCHKCHVQLPLPLLREVDPTLQAT
jgi:hypothetical protein